MSQPFPQRLDNIHGYGCVTRLSRQHLHWTHPVKHR